MKKRTSVYVDAELLDWAKQNGVNISQLLENVLRSIKNRKNPVNALDLGSSPVGVRGFKSLPPHRAFLLFSRSYSDKAALSASDRLASCVVLRRVLFSAI